MSILGEDHNNKVMDPVASLKCPIGHCAVPVRALQSCVSGSWSPMCQYIPLFSTPLGRVINSQAPLLHFPLPYLI